MRNIQLFFISITVALAVLATIPFCLSEKRIQRKLEIARGGKKINFV